MEKLKPLYLVKQEPCLLKDCPPGLFLRDDKLYVKTTKFVIGSLSLCYAAALSDKEIMMEDTSTEAFETVTVTPMEAVEEESENALIRLTPISAACRLDHCVSHLYWYRGYTILNPGRRYTPVNHVELLSGTPVDDIGCAPLQYLGNASSVYPVGIESLEQQKEYSVTLVYEMGVRVHIRAKSQKEAKQLAHACELKKHRQLTTKECVYALELKGKKDEND